MSAFEPAFRAPQLCALDHTGCSCRRQVIRGSGREFLRLNRLIRSSAVELGRPSAHSPKGQCLRGAPRVSLPPRSTGEPNAEAHIEDTEAERAQGGAAAGGAAPARDPADSRREARRPHDVMTPRIRTRSTRRSFRCVRPRARRTSGSFSSTTSASARPPPSVARAIRPRRNGLPRRGCSTLGFHTTALCSPTRAALLTGRNHHSVGMGAITEMATSAPGQQQHPPPRTRRRSPRS